jgi:hypothetical protein
MVSVPGPVAATSAPAALRTSIARPGTVVRTVTRPPDAVAISSATLASAITRPRPTTTR